MPGLHTGSQSLTPVSGTQHIEQQNFIQYLASEKHKIKKLKLETSIETLKLVSQRPHHLTVILTHTV